VLDGLVRFEMIGRVAVQPAFVRVQAAFASDALGHDLVDIRFVGYRDMECANPAAALGQNDDWTLIRRFAALDERAAFASRRDVGLLGAAEIGLIGFDDLAAATHGRKATGAHARRRRLESV
jgi:hypothetical protein